MIGDSASPRWMVIGKTWTCSTCDGTEWASAPASSTAEYHRCPMCGDTPRTMAAALARTTICEVPA